MSRVVESASKASLPEKVRGRSSLSAAVELTKPGITKLVTITSGLSFFAAWLMPGVHTGVLWLEAIACIVGTALSASGANALNMWFERDLDALMDRTSSRPIPSGEMSARRAFVIGLSLAVIGPAMLWAFNGWLPAVISLLTTLLYVLIYTPSKQWTPLSTVIGSVPGAMPMLIGWTAGSSAVGLGSLMEPGGWSLFLILFVWQVPHFLAIAWRYADDYARAGHRVLPAIDESGHSTALVMLVWTLCLLPSTLTPIVAIPHVAGPIYAAVATLTGLLFIAAAIRLIRTPTGAHARAVFFASIVHLPLLLAALVGEGALRQILNA